MDPVSVGYLVLGAVQVTQRIVNLFNSIKDGSPKVDQIYYRLLAERERTEAWANSMRVMNGTDLRSTIPPEKYAEVKKLLEKLSEYYTRAEEKYARIEIKPSEKGIAANLKARTKFVLSGSEDLKDLVDVIGAMNKALKAIAPPLPPYSRRTHMEGFASRMEPEIPSGSMPSTSWRSGGAESSTLRPESELSTTIGQQTQIQEEHGSIGELEEELTYLPSLQTIYDLCLESLLKIAHRHKNKLLENAASRLRLWGAGIFESPAPLDNVLRRKEKDSDTLRQALLNAIANVLVLEGMISTCSSASFQDPDVFPERELHTLLGNKSGVENDELAYFRTEISSLLGTDELVQIAVRKWAIFLSRQRDEKEQPKTQDTTTDIKMSGPGPIKPDFEVRIEEVPENDFGSISRIVESLFDLLPAIRAERRSYCLLLEQLEAGKIDDSQSVSAPSAAESTIEDDWHRIEGFIKKRDERATRQGRHVKLYEPVFKKEKERLAEYRATRTASSKSSMKAADLKAFQEKQEQISNVLCKW